MEGSELLIKYKHTGDINLRNQIVLRYMNVVKYAALSLRNIYAKYGEAEDVINEGVLALISAIEKYDPDLNTKFETYASIKVRGAIIDYVRKQDWIPRQVRKFGRELDDAYNELYNTLGHQPTNDELCEHMGYEPKKFSKLMADVASAVTLSFEEILYEDNFDQSNLSFEEADKNIYDKELKMMIKNAIDKLPIREKKVISLYYYEKLKFSEIAKILGVSESRICQIHTNAMLALKKDLEYYVKKL